MDSSNHNHSQQQEDINRFRVVIRVRPFLDDELQGGKKGKHQCVQFYKDSQTLSLIRPNYDQRDFLFDCVMDQQGEQETAYDQIAYPVVQDVLNGFNGVVMAYGQTGSGKTHTIFGSRASLDSLTQSNTDEGLHYQCGIVPRCVNHIFDHIRDNPNKAQFRVTVSFLEIYMETITDLLLPQTAASQQPSSSPRNFGRASSSMSPIRQGGSSSSLNSNQGQGSNLQIREDPKTGIFVHGLTQINVRNKEQMFQIIQKAAKKRSVNSTAMNKNSSRSHAVLQIFVEQRWVEKPDNDMEVSPERSNNVKKRHHRKALLTIVDLAGSERLSKTGSEGLRLQEAKNINKSIAALSNCISALASDKSLQHVPFRDSKLTRLLTESLGGNCKTTICACISPSMIHYDESYSTLLFATRAMSVKTFVTMNEKVEYKMLDEEGRAGSPMGSRSNNSQQEKHLIKKNSELQEQTEELRQEVMQLKDQIKKQQSLVSSYQSMPYNNQIINNYNSANTNQSMDATNQGAPSSNMAWGAQSMYQKPSGGGGNGSSNMMNFNMNPSNQNIHINRSSSPPPASSYNPLMMNNFVNGKNNLFGAIISPQKGMPFQINQMINQDSENFHFDGPSQPPVVVNQFNNTSNQGSSKAQMKQHSMMMQKLTLMIESLQDQVMAKSSEIQQLKDENQQLKQQQSMQTNSQGINSTIDTILGNPAFKQALFEKLAKINFSS